jgi:hypothetical protein
MLELLQRDVRPARLTLHRAPTSANDPASAQASRMGANRRSSTVIAGASSSYPVRESSGKTTTRAPAERTVAACITAFAATSQGTHSGWATATINGSRKRTPSPAGELEKS